MIFTRTSSGLGNQHLFHNVDFIVYVEGGESFSIAQIDEGMFSEKSIDSIFWEKIFNRYKPGRVKFKPIGSKTAVKKMAENIVNNNVEYTYAAMDQEFDMILNTNLLHPMILYTFGYSWENDVWNEDVVIEILKTLTAEKTNEEKVNELFISFIEEIQDYVNLDAYLFKGDDSFFPRPSGHMKLIQSNVTLAPTVKLDEANTLALRKTYNREDVLMFATNNNVQVRRNCYGHLFGDFCKNLVKHILKIIHNLTGISDEIIRRSAISIFPNFVDENVEAHYVKLFSEE